MDVIKGKIVEIDTNTLISTFFANNWILILIGMSLILFLTYVTWSEGKKDDKFVKIFTDKFVMIWNLIRFKGLKK